MFEEARLSARALLDYGDSFFNPTVRLGVTGLSRAGKTVFITALVHGLTRGGRFRPHSAHRNGTDCDFLPMGSTAATQRFVNLMYSTGGVSFVLYNNRRIRGVRPYPGHNGHLHMHIR